MDKNLEDGFDNLEIVLERDEEMEKASAKRLKEIEEIERANFVSDFIDSNIEPD